MKRKSVRLSNSGSSMFPLYEALACYQELQGQLSHTHTHGYTHAWEKKTVCGERIRQRGGRERERKRGVCLVLSVNERATL